MQAVPPRICCSRKFGPKLSGGLRSPIRSAAPPLWKPFSKSRPSTLKTMYRLTSEQEAVVAKAKAIAESVIATHAPDVDAQGRFPHESMKALADAGMWGLLVPAEFGGTGQGLRVLAAVVD